MQTQLSRPALLARCCPAKAVIGVNRAGVRCSAQKPGSDRQQSATQPGAGAAIAASLAAVLLMSAVTPQDALAARSGGRVGGSSFRSAAPRAAPRAAPAPSRGGGGGGGGTVRNYYNYNSGPSIAPPLIGGYGSPFGGFGYGPFGGFRPIFAPVIGFPLGGFFQVAIGFFVLSTIFNVVRGIASNKREDDDDF